MHEVGLITETIDLATSLAKEQGAAKIHRLVLRVGAYSGVDAEALRLAFDAASPGTAAEHAQLVIDEVAARCWCAVCEAEFVPESPIFACPTCGNVSRELRQGGELELATLEVS